MASALKALLAAHLLAGRNTGLVFGENGKSASPAANTTRADDAWKTAKLERITLHEARHTYASMMIAARVNTKAPSTYMGHANISITPVRYGHLTPGNEAEAATLLDVCLQQRRCRCLQHLALRRSYIRLQVADPDTRCRQR